MNPTMIESAEGKEQLLCVALAIAREAGLLIKEGYRNHPTVEFKARRTDIVTRFDREGERFIRARLLAETPFPVMGEEEGGSEPLRPDMPVWYVDPIDGTTNFAHGHPFYCVSIGLVCAGCSRIGVVVAPSLGIEWTGVEGGQARRNGDRIVVSTTPTIADALLATGFPYDRAVSDDNNFDAFVAIKRQCQAIRRCGSAAIDLCLVADGTYDGYWERKLKPWDISGGAAVVAAAGGRFSAIDGGPVDLAQCHVLASNGLLHQVLIDSLGRVLKE